MLIAKLSMISGSAGARLRGLKQINFILNLGYPYPLEIGIHKSPKNLYPENVSEMTHF